MALEVKITPPITTGKGQVAIMAFMMRGRGQRCIYKRCFLPLPRRAHGYGNIYEHKRAADQYARLWETSRDERFKGEQPCAAGRFPERHAATDKL